MNVWAFFFFVYFHFVSFSTSDNKHIVSQIFSLCRLVFLSVYYIIFLISYFSQMLDIESIVRSVFQHSKSILQPLGIDRIPVGGTNAKKNTHIIFVMGWWMYHHHHKHETHSPTSLNLCVFFFFLFCIYYFVLVFFYLLLCREKVFCLRLAHEFHIVFSMLIFADVDQNDRRLTDDWNGLPVLLHSLDLSCLGGPIFGSHQPSACVILAVVCLLLDVWLCIRSIDDYEW